MGKRIGHNNLEHARHCVNTFPDLLEACDEAGQHLALCANLMAQSDETFDDEFGTPHRLSDVAYVAGFYIAACRAAIRKATD